MTNHKVAYVFPGQGSQAVGMGKDVYSRFTEARAVYAIADEALGSPISSLCFEGPDDELNKTLNAQPAVLTTSIAYLYAAKQQMGDSLLPPSFAAGHSLGLYSALVVSGVLDLADAVRLVRERGRLMHEAGQAQPGGMLAVIGGDDAVLEEVCDLAGVDISNRNSPGQVVISGPLASLEEFKKQAAARGIRRMIPLKVSGAFHSRLMQPAAEGLKKAIAQYRFMTPSIPVISNVTGNVLSDVQEIRGELVSQLTECVMWQRSVENMISSGVNTFYEIGHGQVMSGLIKRINQDVNVMLVADLINAAN